MFQDRKEYLLIEAGIRVHTTSYARETPAAPSGFVSRLRHYVRRRRVFKVTQLGVDRVVCVQFGKDDPYYLIVELYDSGNIILADEKYRILALWRTVSESGGVLRQVVGGVYPIDHVRKASALCLQDVKTRLSECPQNSPLKVALGSIIDAGRVVTEHVMLEHAIDRKMTVASFIASQSFSKLERMVNRASEILKEICSENCKGYIYLKDVVTQPLATKGVSGAKFSHEEPLVQSIAESSIRFENFESYPLAQFSAKEFREFPSFVEAVDVFFSGFEQRKLTQRMVQKESSYLKKVNAARDDQEHRIEALVKSTQDARLKAQLIEANLTIVDQVILAVRAMVASSMDWKDLEKLVELERQQGNQIACVIKRLKLEHNIVSVLLNNPREYSADVGTSDGPQENFEAPRNESSDGSSAGEGAGVEDGDEEFVEVDLDISMGAFKNANRYYNVKKYAEKKREKTLAVADQAFSSARRKIAKTFKEQPAIPTLTAIRKPIWFEKFLFFISSDKYLVLGGRDVQQNELLVRRYMRSGDIYLHADMHGAPSVVIKNPSGQEVPPNTLQQAGIMAISYSSAWKHKVVTSAYWVLADQVSKTPPTGEYLPAGSFMIRGKKNFLHPTQLVYGFGLLFKLRSCADDEDDVEDDEHDDQGEIAGEETGTGQHDSKDAGTLAMSSLSTDGERSHRESEEYRPNCAGNEGRETDVKEGEPSGAGGSGPASSEEPLVKHASSRPYLSANELRQRKKLAGRSEGVTGATKDSNESCLPAPQASRTKREPQPKRTGRNRQKYKRDFDEAELELRAQLLGAPAPKAATAQEPGSSAAASRASSTHQGKERWSNQDAGKQRRKPIVADGPNLSGDLAVLGRLTESLDSILKALRRAREVTGSGPGGEPSEPDTSKPKPSAEDNDDDNEEKGPQLKCLRDVISHPIPVFAPYTALARYDFKVKVTPGSIPKGKAARALIGELESKVASVVRQGGGGDNNGLAKEVSSILKSTSEADMIARMVSGIAPFASGKAGGARSRTGGAKGKRGSKK